MEKAESKGKKRILPLWMTNEPTESKKRATKDVKKKKTEPPKTRTIYLMNEKELVRYAMAIIHKSRKEEEAEEDMESEEEDKAAPCRDEGQKPRSPPHEASSPDKVPLPKALERHSAVAADDEDDPLKYVREIFFS